MVNIEVGIDPKQLTKIDRQCGILTDKGKVDAAITMAAKRAADAAKAETKRQITKEYTISSSHVAETITTGKNPDGMIGAFMKIEDSPISLTKFTGTKPNKPKPKAPQPQQIQVQKSNSGFVTTKWFPVEMADTGHIGIFGKVTGTRMKYPYRQSVYSYNRRRIKKWGVNPNKKGRMQIKEAKGPATTGMFKNPAVSDNVTKRAEEVFAKRLDHEIGRLMGK